VIAGSRIKSSSTSYIGRYILKVSPGLITIKIKRIFTYGLSLQNVHRLNSIRTAVFRSEWVIHQVELMDFIHTTKASFGIFRVKTKEEDFRAERYFHVYLVLLSRFVTNSFGWYILEIHHWRITRIVWEMNIFSIKILYTILIYSNYVYCRL
jgi:hypothetical protein